MQQQRLKEQTAALLKASGSMSKSASSLQQVKYEWITGLPYFSDIDLVTQAQQPPPLSAPTLVLAACRGSRGVLTMPDYADISRNFESLELAANSNGSGGGVDAEHILACLSAMQTRQQQLQQQYHNHNDVSITIGASTKLTIASDASRCV